MRQRQKKGEKKIGKIDEEKAQPRCARPSLGGGRGWARGACVYVQALPLTMLMKKKKTIEKTSKWKKTQIKQFLFMAPFLMIPLSAASNERRITVGWQAIARASSVFKDKCANHSKKNLRSVHLTDSHIWIRNVESHNEANVTITVNAARTLKNYASSQLERRKNSKADT